MKNKNNEAHNNEESEFKEILVAINRVAKVVKGGRRFGFAAVVVVGDGKGKVGYGLGKAKEVMEAKIKATQAAKKAMIRVYLREGRTLHHDVKGHSGAGKVLLRSAKPGTGIIAGGPMRAIFDALGVHDVVAKSTGSSNVHNMVGATFDALSNLSSPKLIAEKRNKKIGEIIERRETNEAKK
jgi:small subunit ribosomal protein S5